MDHIDKIGLLVDVPNIGKAKIKYIGPVETKNGTFVGVDLLSGVGKNDGSFKGKRYFETRSGQSGLFIQWEKVAGLLPKTDSDGIDRFPNSPTPVRDRKADAQLELSLPNSLVLDGERSNDSGNIYEAELFQYKRMVDDQRIVLEEIQLAIDEYETKLESIERERNGLQQQLDHERLAHERQKQFYENEHEQLLSVIDELQHEINRNTSILADLLKNDKEVIKKSEGSLLGANQNGEATVGHQDDTLLKSLKEQIAELQHYRNQQEISKLKWEKEREQLKLHNQSLSQEYQSLSKELLEHQNMIKRSEDTALHAELERARERIAALEKQVEQSLSRKAEENQDIDMDEKLDSLPLYNPTGTGNTLINAAAGRALWCALCEKDGHESVDCPYDDKFF